MSKPIEKDFNELYLLKFSPIEGSKALWVSLMQAGSEQVIFKESCNPAQPNKRKQWIDNALQIEGIDVTGCREWLDNRLKDAVDAMIQQAAARNNKDAPADDDTGSPRQKADLALKQMPESVVETAKKLLQSENLMDEINGHLGTLVAGEVRLRQLAYLYGTSRLLHDPLHLIITGPSSSGKSYTLSRSLSLFPEESIITATRFSKLSMMYVSRNALRHRIFAAGERDRHQSDESADKTKLVREMISSKRLSNFVTEKHGEEMVSVEVVIDGPIAYSESTTLLDIFGEDRNRCIVLPTDESAEQTRRIMGLHTANITTDEEPPQDALQQLHWAMQRLLQTKRIVIPFADSLEALMADDACNSVEMRRAYPLLTGAISATALLHQFQRERTKRGSVVATIKDYEVIKPIIEEWFTDVVRSTIPEQQAAFYLKLRQFMGCANDTDAEEHKAGSMLTFTNSQLVEHGLGSKPSVSRNLQALEDAGLVSPCNDGWNTGQSKMRHLVHGGPLPQQGLPVLPAVEHLLEAHEERLAIQGEG